MPATATKTVAISAVADTYVRADLDVRKNDNYGHERVMSVGTGRGSSVGPVGAKDAMRAFVQFDLTGVPPVEKASLELTVHSVGGALDQPYTVGVYRVIQPWEEGNGAEGYRDKVAGTTDTDHASGIAWEPAPGSQNKPHPPFDAKPIAEMKIDPKAVKAGTAVTWDITPLVSQWLQDPRTNCGLMLRDVTTGGAFRQLSFGSHEADSGQFPDGVQGPRLAIEAVVLPPPHMLTYNDMNAALKSIPDQYSYNTRFNKAVVKWFELVGVDPANGTLKVKCRFRYQKFEKLLWKTVKVADKACNFDLSIKVGVEAGKLVVSTYNAQKYGEEGWGIDLAIKAIPVAVGAGIGFYVGGPAAASAGAKIGTSIAKEVLHVYPDERVGDVNATATAAIAQALAALVPVGTMKSAHFEGGDLILEVVQPS